MKNLFTLAIALVIFAAAWWLAAERRPATEVTRVEFMPELLDAVNEVASVSLKTGSEETTLAKDGDAWVVASSDGYPADVERVKKLVLELAALRVLEEKTSSPDKHARIGLTAPDADGSTSLQVSLADASGNPLASIIIGDAGKAGSAATRYVRRATQDQSYLVAGELDYRAAPREWMTTEIADIQPERIVGVSVAPTDGVTYSLSRLVGEQGQLLLVDLPEGEEERSRATTESMSTFLSQLRFDAVRSASTAGDVTPAFTAHYQTREGVDVEVTGYPVDGETWLAFSASHDPSQVIDDERLPEVPAAAMIMGPGAEQPEPDSFDGAEVAAALNARSAGWLYKVPSFKLSMVERDRSALTQSARERVEAVEPEEIENN